MGGEPSCATLRLSGESFDPQKGAEAECNALAIHFDLKNCSDQEPLHPPKIQCAKDGATVSLLTKRFRYQASLRRYVGEKGNSLWDISEPVKESLRAAFQEHMKSAQSKAPVLVPASGNRSPASVQGVTEKSQTEKAQEPTAAAPPTSAASSATAPPPPIAISGMLDLYFGHNFNRPAAVALPTQTNTGLPTQQNQLRNFDLYSDQFGLNLAELTFKKTGKEVNFFADLDFGQSADYVSRSSTGATDDVSKHIGQAVLSYAPSAAPGLSFSVGKMDSNMGYETTKAINNWQYSRSFLFSQALPYWHLGASATYAIVPDKLTVTAYVYNGWNSLYSNNGGKTYALQATWNISSAVAITYNGIAGPEQAGDTTDLTQVHEVIATWNASEKLQFAWDTTYGSAGRANLGLGKANWGASTLAFKYQVLPWYSISPRIEFYRDTNGYTTGASQNISSVTVTQAIKHPEGIEPRLEFRRDQSSAASFISNRGPTSTQSTLTFALLYAF